MSRSAPSPTTPAAIERTPAVLLYLKPTLTGDEPCDITQYRTRNKDFPHESTGDQFYDEAQWESYRRLGEHAACSALRFVERDAAQTDRRIRCSTTPAGNGINRPSGCNEKIRRAHWAVHRARSSSFARRRHATSSARCIPRSCRRWPQKRRTDYCHDCRRRCAQTLYFLVQIIQLMEDAWLVCHLETHWNDPNNLGWMNAFQRWAYTPSFRLWWPILKPMYGRQIPPFYGRASQISRTKIIPTTMDEVNIADTACPMAWRRFIGSECTQQDPNGARRIRQFIRTISS